MDRPVAAATDGWSLGHRPGLDHVRGVAVLLVVLGHTIHRWGVGGAGRVGVAIFFVLSGFLITRLLLEERDRTGRVSLGRFYLRRARRLLPALLVFLPLAAIVNDHLGLWVRQPVIATLTYTANYASVRHGIEYASFTHLWSLAVEEHFYLVWPALVLFFGRRWLLPACVVGVVVVAIARSAVADTDPNLAFRATHLRIDAMLVGAALAVVIARVPRPPRLVVIAAGACLVVACYATFLDPLLDWGFVVVELATAVVLVEALWWPAGRGRWLAHVGVISYGLYLFHLPIALWLQAHDTPEALEPVATLGLSLAVAELSYHLIERPIRYGWRRSRQPTAVSR